MGRAAASAVASQAADQVRPARATLPRFADVWRRGQGVQPRVNPALPAPLLLAPGGFEGLGPVTKAINADYEAVSKCVEVGELDVLSNCFCSSRPR